MDDLTYPAGELTSEQKDAAEYARVLFARLARSAGVEENARFGAFPLDSGAVVVVRQVKGGGQIYVAPDRSVLYVGSALSESQADEAFASGHRTPIEKFGPPLTS